jgi:Nickel/cobalt transporter regulator
MRFARTMIAQSLVAGMLAGGTVIAQGPPNKPSGPPPSKGPSRPSGPPSQGSKPSRPPSNGSKPSGPPPNGSKPSGPSHGPSRPPSQGPGHPSNPPRPPGGPSGPSRPPGPPPSHGPSRPPGGGPPPHGGGRPPGPPPNQWHPPRPPGAGGGYVHYDQWRRGYRLPPSYWNRGIVIVNYGPYHLHPPPPGYQWRYIDGNYVLAAVATGIISSVIIAAAMQ